MKFNSFLKPQGTTLSHPEPDLKTIEKVITCNCFYNYGNLFSQHLECKDVLVVERTFASQEILTIMEVTIESFTKFFTVRNSSCEKVMFSQVCVKNSVPGGWCTPPWQVPPCAETPPGRHLPWADTTPQDRHAPRQTPPRQTHTHGQTPPGQTPPSTAAVGTHPTGMHSC